MPAAVPGRKLDAGNVSADSEDDRSMQYSQLPTKGRRVIKKPSIEIVGETSQELDNTEIGSDEVEVDELDEGEEVNSDIERQASSPDEGPFTRPSTSLLQKKSTVVVDTPPTPSPKKSGMKHPAPPSPDHSTDKLLESEEEVVVGKGKAHAWVSTRASRNKVPPKSAAVIVSDSDIEIIQQQGQSETEDVFSTPTKPSLRNVAGTHGVAATTKQKTTVVVTDHKFKVVPGITKTTVVPKVEEDLANPFDTPDVDEVEKSLRKKKRGDTRKPADCNDTKLVVDVTTPYVQFSVTRTIFIDVDLSKTLTTLSSVRKKLFPSMKDMVPTVKPTVYLEDLEGTGSTDLLPVEEIPRPKFKVLPPDRELVSNLEDADSLRWMDKKLMYSYEPPLAPIVNSILNSSANIVPKQYLCGPDELLMEYAWFSEAMLLAGVEADSDDERQVSLAVNLQHVTRADNHIRNMIHSVTTGTHGSYVYNPARVSLYDFKYEGDPTVRDSYLWHKSAPKVPVALVTFGTVTESSVVTPELLGRTHTPDTLSQRLLVVKPLTIEWNRTWSFIAYHLGYYEDPTKLYLNGWKNGVTFHSLPGREDRYPQLLSPTKKHAGSSKFPSAIVPTVSYGTKAVLHSDIEKPGDIQESIAEIKKLAKNGAPGIWIKVPIYDLSHVTSVHDLQGMEGATKWTEEIPVSSFVAVEYCFGVYKSKHNDDELNLHMLHVAILRRPE
ncbi:hypothetical protein BC835DRAFT_1469209 [Cytidiella melzeri]|nr:hypothetical protein BC835DRAFT_1469209 [Cytidiella melzeri]